MKWNDPTQKVLMAAIPVIIFLCATLPNLHLPGIQYDEVYYVPPAAALLKNQLHDDYVMLDPSVVQLFGKQLPLMFNYYTSFFRTYLTLPVFAIFGINVETIRGSSIAHGVLALIFFIAFAKALTRNSFIAFATGLLLACDASFVAYIHNDFAVVATMMVLKSIALWALLRWWQEAGTKFLYIGTFFLGLGITDRASFLWILMAMPATMLLIYGKAIFLEIKKHMDSTRTVLFAAGSFCVGASIFLAFNIVTLGGTFTPMLSNFGKTSGGVNNFAFFENFYLRLKMLSEVLGGEYLNHFILGDLMYQTGDWNFSGSPLSWLAPLAYCYFIVKLAVRRFHKSSGADFFGINQRPLLFILWASFFLLILTSFTPTLHRGHQLLMLYPFPHLVVAIFVFDVIAVLLKKWKTTDMRRLNLVGLFVLIVISASSVRPILSYHNMLVQTGGIGTWSDAIYEIVAEADKHPERTVVCMDWGFNANILSLSKNPVRTLRNYYIDTRRSPEQLSELFDTRHTFLFHTPEYTMMAESRNDFANAVALSGAKVDTLRVFHQRDGKPVAVLLFAQRQP